MANKVFKIFKVIHYCIDEKAKGAIIDALTVPAKVISWDNEDPIQISAEQNGGDIYVASIKRLRMRNLPKIGKEKSKNERKVDLNNEEGLIEKFYLAFNASTEELAVQQNGNVCRDVSFPRLMSKLSGVPLSSIRPIETGKKLDESHQVIQAELTIQPTAETPNNYDHGFDKTVDDFTRQLTVNPSQRISLVISPGNDPKKRDSFLSVSNLQRLVQWGRATKARVTVLNPDASYEIIDLIKDLKKSNIEVAMDGRYPNAASVIEAIKGCIPS